MSEIENNMETVKKKNFFLKHYALTSIVIIYITAILSHILAVHVNYIFKDTSNIVLIFLIIFFVYSAVKSKEDVKIGKKVLSGIGSFILAAFLLGLFQQLGGRTVLGIQQVYVTKLDAEWAKEASNSDFSPHMQAYLLAHSHEIDGDSMEEIAKNTILQYRANVFIPKFNKENKLLYFFMIPANNPNRKFAKTSF